MQIAYLKYSINEYNIAEHNRIQNSHWYVSSLIDLYAYTNDGRKQQ